MTPDQIAEARQACEAATPTAMTQVSQFNGNDWVLLREYEDGLINMRLPIGKFPAKADALFHQLARTALPAALDEVERLSGVKVEYASILAYATKENDRLRARVAQLEDIANRLAEAGITRSEGEP